MVVVRDGTANAAMPSQWRAYTTKFDDVRHAVLMLARKLYDHRRLDHTIVGSMMQMK